MSAATRTAPDELVVLWLSLTLAGGFAWWTVAAAPAELADAQVGLARYLIALSQAALPALAVTAILHLLRAGDWLARLACASALCYLAFLKAAGLPAAPWVALGLAAAATVLLARRRLQVTPLLLLAHVMGTLTAAYFVFSLDRYLPGREALLDVLRGLRWALW